jgi:formylglycine-generating enzyme required for sulfatase activity
MLLQLTEGGKAKYRQAKEDYVLSEEQLFKRENNKISSRETSSTEKATRGKAKRLTFDYLAELLGSGWYKKKVSDFFNGNICITEPEAKKVCETLNILFNIQDFKKKPSKYSIQNTNLTCDEPSHRELVPIHPELGSITHFAEKTDIIKPVALDDWIEDIKEEVISKFRDAKKYSELSGLVLLKVKLNHQNRECHVSRNYLKNIATNQSSQMLLIWAEEGSGKSTIAFQIACWGFDKELSEYTILPILLKPLSDTETVIGQIHKYFINVTKYTEETLSEHFVEMLVSQKRLLLIVDQFSDLTAVQKERFIETLPAKSLLLITSREDESDLFTYFTIHTIEPQRLGKEDLSFFITDFLHKKESQFTSEEVQSVFSKIVGNHAITPLLATIALEKTLEYLNDFNKFRTDQSLSVNNFSLPTIDIKELLENYIMCICARSYHKVHNLCNDVQKLLSEYASDAAQVDVSVAQDSDDNKGLHLKIYNYNLIINLTKMNVNNIKLLNPLFPLLYALWLASDKNSISKLLDTKQEIKPQIFLIHITHLIYFVSITRFNELTDPLCRVEWLDILERSAIGNEMSPEIFNCLSKIVKVTEQTTNFPECYEILVVIEQVIQKSNHRLFPSLLTVFLRFTVNLIKRTHKDNHYVQISKLAIRTLSLLGTDVAVDNLLEIANEECYTLELRIEAIRSFELIEQVDFSFSRLNEYYNLLIRRRIDFSLNEIRKSVSACPFYLLTAVSRTLHRLSYSKIPQWGRPEGLRIPMLCLESDYKNDSCNLSLQQIEPEVWHLPLPNEQKIEVICINADFYTLGSPEQEAFRDTVYGTKHVASSDHIECIRSVEMHKFLISRNPVTHAQFKSLVEGMVFPALQSPFDDDNFPIVNLSSKEAIEWCKIFTKFLHSKFILYENESVSLPTSDQWEIACRAGSSHAYHFGRDLLPEYSNFNPDSYSNENRSEKHKYQPIESGHFGVSNNWGISDMHGNVFEWCLNPKSDTTAIARGGSFRTGSAYCRSAYQKKIERIDYTENDIGFRICVRIFK